VLFAFPLLAFLLIWLTLHRLGRGVRFSFLGASVIWGACVVVVTETLSVPTWLNRGAVAVFWLCICAVAGLFFWLAGPSDSGWQDDRPAKLDRSTQFALVGAGLVMLLVSVTAVASAPNIWDAMEYHLPRTILWMSHHSVRNFATPDYRQLIFAPWSEFAMMHLDLLWGGDRLVNLVEFFSLLGCAVGASLIAELLGADPRGQVLAAVVSATIPEGVLEASGPMNQYVLAFWITAAVVFLLDWNRKPSWTAGLFGGLAVGLALLTKGTAFVFLPFLAAACFWAGSAYTRIRLLKRGVAILAVILALNLPQFLRCYDLTGSFLGVPFRDAGPTFRLSVAHVSAVGTLANALRNASLHLGTPSPKIDAQIERLVRSVIHRLGDDADDPSEIWPGESFSVHNFSLHEVHAGNPVHLFLLLVALVAVFWDSHWAHRREVRAFALGLVASFLLFSALLRWSTWDSRQQLPLFVLGSVLIGILLGRLAAKGLSVALTALFLIFSLPFALANRTRSLVPWTAVDNIYHPRAELYFSDQHEPVAAANIAMAEAVNRADCRYVALDSYVDRPDSTIVRMPKSFFVYPTLSLIHADGQRRTVWYTGVHNWSSRYAARDKAFACEVVCFDCVRAPDKAADYLQHGWQESVYGNDIIFSLHPSR
jgi:hypothetical protein